MSNNKQTAVEWLFDRFFMLFLFQDGIPEELQEAYEQAKQMEKQQIIDANEDASTNELGEFLTGEQYYNKEYGGNNEQQ